MIRTATITSVPGYIEWRNAARKFLELRVPPEQIVWQSGENVQNDLFSVPAKHVSTDEPHSPTRIPKFVLVLFQLALCHHNSKRFALCYRLLWRFVFENRNLFQMKTDDDVMQITALVKAVKRDAYKMSAYLRFREVNHEGKEHFVAWYEPEHFTLEHKLDFFKTRFKNMCWSILTPYRAAHWDKKVIVLEDNPDPSVYPDTDRIEKYWLTYYANIFNPARTKKSAMLSNMPKKYWKNMPETVLIEQMMKTSDARVRHMITESNRAIGEKPPAPDHSVTMR